jgi:hypothetical protein
MGVTTWSVETARPTAVGTFVRDDRSGIGGRESVVGAGTTALDGETRFRAHFSIGRKEGSSQQRGSGCATKLDDGEMLSPFNEAHREPDLVTALTAMARTMRPTGSRFNLSSLRRSSVVDFARCLPGESHVWSFGVVPDRVQTDLTSHRGKRQRNEKTPCALLFHGPNKSLDKSDARWFADGPVAWSYATSLTPTLESATTELFALVGDDVFGRGLARPEGTVEEALDLSGRRRLRIYRESDENSGHLVDRNGDPPAERPTLRQCEREPWHPKARSCRHGRQVDMPTMPGMLGDDTASTLGEHVRPRFRRPGVLPNHATDCRRAQDQPRPTEHIRHSFRAGTGDEPCQLRRTVASRRGARQENLSRGPGNRRMVLEVVDISPQPGRWISEKCVETS